MARNRKKNKKKKQKLEKNATIGPEILEIQQEKKTISLKEKSYRILTFHPGVIRPPRYIL